MNELPQFTIGVIQYTRVGPYLAPETIEQHQVHGFNAHDALVAHLRGYYENRPDIKIAGPGHVVYKDIDSKQIPASASTTE